MKKYLLFFIVVFLSCAKKEKTVVKYYDSGELESKVNYYNHKDTLSFSFQSFYKNGNLKVETFFKDGKREGSYISYFENGSIKENYSYQNGLKHGSFKQYNNDGNLIEETFYYQGKLLLQKIVEVNSKRSLIRHIFYKPINDSTLSSIGVIVFDKEGKVLEDASFFYDVVRVDTASSQLDIVFYNKRNDVLFSYEEGVLNEKGQIDLPGFKVETYDSILTIKYPKGIPVITGLISLKKDSTMYFPFYKQF